MTLFVTIAALITALVLFAVLRPLWAGAGRSDAAAQSGQLNLAVLRDQLRELDADLAAGTIDAPAHAGARRELEQRVSEDVRPGSLAPAAPPASALRWQAAVLGLAVAVGAAGLYARFGAPAAMKVAGGGAAAAPDSALFQPESGTAPHAAGEAEAEASVARLAQRMASEPKNADGWLLLARSYSAMNRFDAASAAYAKLMPLIPADGQLLADYADVLAMTQNQSLRGEPERLLERALAADPNNVKALVMGGAAAYERGDAAAAIGHWQAVLKLAPPNSGLVRMAQANIDHALQGNPGIRQAPAGVGASMGQEATASAPPGSAAARAGQVAGTVELDPALLAQAGPDDTVFIFARAADGPRFPLAVLRKRVRDLPLHFALDDTMGMMPDVKLSAFKQLVVGARISKSGSATAAPGDLEGVLEGVPNGSTELRIKIGTQRH